MLFAGLDVSTQSCKLVVIDTKSEQVVFVDSVNYDTDLPEFNTKNGVIQGLPEGVSESDPTMWIRAVDMVFLYLKESDIPQQQLKCISVSGQQHGLVTLDSTGNLSRLTSKLWNDFSTQEECDLLNNAIGGPDKMIAEVGNSQRTGYTASKILHFKRNEPEKFKETDTFFLVHNYINWYLTGGVKVMEPGDTSGMALWHPGTGKWSDKVIKSIDPALESKLPEIQPADKSIGVISSNLAEKYGLNPECKIDAGSGDNMYGAIGTGNVEPGIVTISLGTSGTAYTLLEEPYIDSTGEISVFCDSTGNHLPLVCVSNLANGYNQILKQYDITHDQFSSIVQKTEPGNNGRLLIPWYEGERTPDVPNAAPLYFGFGLDEFTRENLCRAVLEGHILNLYDGFLRLPVKPREIRLTGGLSKSEVWRQTIADIFETETVPVEGEGAALGAALHAAWVWLKEMQESFALKDLVSSFVILSESEREEPINENIQIYKKQKQIFRALSGRIRAEINGDPFKIRNELIQLVK